MIETNSPRIDCLTSNDQGSVTLYLPILNECEDLIHMFVGFIHIPFLVFMSQLLIWRDVLFSKSYEYLQALR